MGAISGVRQLTARRSEGVSWGVLGRPGGAVTACPSVTNARLRGRVRFSVTAAAVTFGKGNAVEAVKGQQARQRGSAGERPTPGALGCGG